jgi:splicing factor, arginine/serine-rich 4/5/6
MYLCLQEMSTRVYLGRLADSARDRDVERFFKGYGRIKEILLKNGYGFVVSFKLSSTF